MVAAWRAGVDAEAFGAEPAGDTASGAVDTLFSSPSGRQVVRTKKCILWLCQLRDFTMAVVQHLERIDWEAVVRVVCGCVAGSVLWAFLG